MRVPPWARWALAAVLVLGIATAGVAANLAVLGSTNDDVQLGTLNAGSLAAPAAGAGQAAQPTGAGQATRGDDEHAGEHHAARGDDPDDD